MGKSHDLATLKDDGGTFKSSLVIDTGTNGTPNIDFKHANSSADQFRLQAGTPAVTNGGFSIYDIDAAQTRLNIDASGRVTMPYQPSFKAHITGGSITVVSNDGNSAVFNATDHNVGSHYSTSTGRFTAPIAGRYVFTCSVFKHTTYNNPSNTYWGFTRNGTSILSTNHGSNGYDGGQCISIVTQLAVDDYVDVRCFSGGPIISYGIPYNSFSGHLIG